MAVTANAVLKASLSGAAMPQEKINWAKSSKNAFKHTQNAQIQIIPHMHKSHPSICSPLKHSVILDDSASGQ